MVMPEQHRLERRDQHSEMRQDEKQKEDLHELRRVGEEHDVGADDPLHARAAEGRSDRAQRADHHATAEGQHGDLEADEAAAEQVWNVPDDLSEMEHVAQGGSYHRRGREAPPAPCSAIRNKGCPGSVPTCRSRDHFL